MKKVVIVHGWGGSSQKEWFPWIKRELEGRDCEVFIPDMPDTDEPKIDEWVGYLADLAKEPDENAYFVGHSVGCQTILRYLEALAGRKIGGVILVAPWFNFLNLGEAEDEEIAKPWLETPINFEKVKKATDKIMAIFSDNDPYVPIEENRKILEGKLNAKIIIDRNMGHFNEEYGIAEIPSLLKVFESFIK